MGWVVNTTSRPPYPRERPGTHCIGGWVGPRAVLDWCGKSCRHRDSIPGPSSPYRVALPTELSWPIVVQLLESLSSIYGTGGYFMKMFTRTRYRPLFWARRIQSISSHLRSVPPSGQCFSTFVRPGPVNSFFIRRGPGPNRFTCQDLSNFFKFIH